MSTTTPAYCNWNNSWYYIHDSQTDWNDGHVSNELVRSMGGPAPPASRLRRDPARWEENNQQAIDAAKKLGNYFIQLIQYSKIGCISST